MPYAKKFHETTTLFNPEENGVWTLADFLGDGPQGLVYIKTKNSGGSVEVYGASRKSNFQEKALDAVTAFGAEDNGTWLMNDLTGDGKADLVYIKTRNTNSGKVELHVADAASGYRNFVLQTNTGFELEENGTWTLSAKGDLVYIKTRGTGRKVEYLVASKASNYKTITVHEPTDFDKEDNGTWGLAPRIATGEFADLYYIKTKNPGTTMVEVHAVSASSKWKQRIIDNSTVFDPENNGHWLMSNFTNQAYPDLVYIKTRNTTKVEIHVSQY